MKYRYEIHFNGGSTYPVSSYSFGNTKDIKLFLEEQKASVSFEMSVKHTAEDLTSFKVSLFRDAYRKLYLLHAILYSKGLEVNDIRIVSWNKEESVYTTQDEHFPFLFSMIPNKDVRLKPAWKNLSSYIVNTSKTKTDDDLRMAAVYAYLQSKGRTYAIDRFTNLWTSMNSFYSWIAQNYEKTLRNKFRIDEDAKLKGNLKLVGNDSLSIMVLVSQIYEDYQVPEEDFDQLWAHFYDTEKCLMELRQSDIEKLYDDSLSWMTGTPVSVEMKPLNACAERFGSPLFTYLLLIYPYHWRCNYLHGNRTTLLFSAYNDYELAALHTVNYFIDRFLNENIPEMFSDNYWTEEKQSRAEEFLKRTKDGYLKAYDKLSKSI